jgi:class 3 adenylate cyclase
MVAKRSRSPKEPPRDPRSYTPKHLAEKILTSRSSLEGERKQVTVLFADVKGPMDLAEQVDPEESHQIMDAFPSQAPDPSSPESIRDSR